MFDRYVAMGLERSYLGLPIGDQIVESTKQVGTFAGGLIVWSPATGAWPVRGQILAKWRAIGGTAGVLGFPAADQSSLSGGRTAQRFARGGIYYVPGHGANHLYGGYYEKWSTLSSTNKTVLGYPISGRINVTGGTRMDMQFGGMYASAATGVHWVARAMDTAYRKKYGGVAGLGFPTVDYRPWGSRFRADFQRGVLVWDPATNVVTKL